MNRSFPEIESYLRVHVGINPEATPGIIGRAVERILSEKNIRDSSEYLHMLKQSNSEFDHLLEQVLVPETWFFRYPDAYQYLRRYIQSCRGGACPRPFATSDHKGRPYRILSVPCSTGEEPYSIAITLLDAGLSPKQFLIDAADVSTTALKKARKARYTQNSFRGNDLTYRNRYFERDSGQSQLRIEIRNLVKFFNWNVQEAFPLNPRTKYDVIFCRNLFIYFHPAAQKKMIATLNQLLEFDGLLFSGHAEAGPLLSPDFHPVPPMKAFVHKR